MHAYLRYVRVLCVWFHHSFTMNVTSLNICTCICVCMYARVYRYNRVCMSGVGFTLKLIAFELAAKFSRRRENPVQPRSHNAKDAIFKRAQKGVFPSVAIFAGQLKRTQLYSQKSLDDDR
jgi:hypothetical protein